MKNLTPEAIVREIKITMLHDLLHPESAKEVLKNKYLNTLLSEKCGNRNLGELIEEMIDIKENASTAYIAMVEKIRIFILGS